MLQKMGFWSVLAMVVGSQVGSGVFMLPTSLAPFGTYSILGWIISGLGAIVLSMIFANLCAHFPKTGGPHVYVEKILGRNIAFFTGWTYWVVSWISTTAVVIAAIGYLSPLIGEHSPVTYLWLELTLLLLIASINLLGVGTAGKAETLFTALKFLPLLIVPLGAIFLFQMDNFQLSSEVANSNFSENLAQVTLLTLWGFIGLESATAPAGSVYNPEKTIPKALVIGTATVALIYLFNSIAIMGLIPGNKLQNTVAPYVDATHMIFGGNWHIIISTAASVICIGTLNAWTMASGQISLGLAEDNMMPKTFSRKNKSGAPYASIITSCLGMVPLLVLTANKDLSGQISDVINFSVSSFLFIYWLCSFANFLLAWRNDKNPFQMLLSILAIIFCSWIIYETPIQTLLISILFTASGLPLYLIWYRKNQ